MPLDFENYEYTVFITDLELITDPELVNDGVDQLYMNGFIAICQDNTTAFNFANVMTFSDGEVILSGVVTTLNRRMFTSTLGSVSGNVDWTGGTQVYEMAPADRLDWYLVAGVNTMSFFVEPGFNENWDGKVEPDPPIISNDNKTWSQVKSLFR